MHTYHPRALALALFLLVPALAPAEIIDLEDLVFPNGSNFVNNPSGASPGPNDTVTSTFVSQGAAFNNVFQRPVFGGMPVDVWAGWSYSRVNDVTTPGFGNQYAAYNVPGGGTGAGGSAKYVVGFDDSSTPGGRPVIDLPSGLTPVSVQLTNTTYAALSLLNGDGFAKKFGGPSGNDPDFFLLQITGLDAANNVTGTVDFYLADYRFSDNSLDYAIDSWTTVDLTALGEATKLTFALDSSDFSEFGGVRFLNTPAYFALDNLVVEGTPAVVPEPSTLCLTGVGAATFLAACWRRRRRMT